MTFRCIEPRSAVLVSVPHAGLKYPEFPDRIESVWQSLADTDWHADRLVEGFSDLGVGIITAQLSRFVVDLNRPPDDRPLYRGAGTGLVPVETFAGEPLYRRACGPDEAEVKRRVERYWRPYHDRLNATMENLRVRFGHAVLIDLHSIASRVPRLFDGRLPDLNLGTFDNNSCAHSLQQQAEACLAQAAGFDYVVNGRFKGGYITRHYGQPERGWHALQLEIAQACYLDESRPRLYLPERAAALRGVLRRLLESAQSWRPQ